MRYKNMNTTNEVICAIREKRAKEMSQAARWASYRRAANPPIWFIVLMGAFSLVGMLALAALILADPHRSIATPKLIILPAFVVLCIGAWLFRRREQAIARVLKTEAPEIYEKMKAERLIS
jgi:O-antigen ligase